MDDVTVDEQPFFAPLTRAVLSGASFAAVAIALPIFGNGDWYFWVATVASAIAAVAEFVTARQLWLQQRRKEQ